MFPMTNSVILTRINCRPASFNMLIKSSTERHAELATMRRSIATVAVAV